jgi:hypothetical protein
VLAFLHGSKGAKPVQGTSKAPEAVPMPADLPADQRQVWLELAPHAREARTLTHGTAQAFRDLCEAIVLKRSMLARLEADGLTYLKVTIDGSGQEHTEVKAHPLLAQHRGMMQRVEAGMTRFRLSPIGKEMATSEPEADPFAEFDGDTVQ